MAISLVGSFTALVTPFCPDGSINFPKLKELVEWQVQQGSDGIVALGTTGESSTMSHEEDRRVVDCVLETVNRRIPVICGAGSNCTQTSLEKSREYAEAGADGLLLITPYYNKANDEGMYRHFMTVADQVDLPIILYNVPGRTGCAISIPCLDRLADHPHIVAIKEASGSISYAAHAAAVAGSRLALLSGNDDMVVPILSLGGTGVISVVANAFPAMMHEMVSAFLGGDVKKATAMQLNMIPLVDAMFCEVNPIPVKEAMNQMGMEVGGYRLPLYEISQKGRAQVKAALEGMKA